MVPGVPTYVFFTGALNSVFTNTQNFVPSQVMCCRGSITSNPTVTGNSFGLKNSHSGTILANGSPTYIRIRKECPVSLAGLYPAFEIQLPVGLDDNQASFNKTNFVAGQTASLNPFTISMLLQSGI